MTTVAETDFLASREVGIEKSNENATVVSGITSAFYAGFVQFQMGSSFFTTYFIDVIFNDYHFSSRRRFAG